MTKPNTIAQHHEATSSILRWLQAYPHMRRNAELWFANRRIAAPAGTGDPREARLR